MNASQRELAVEAIAGRNGVLSRMVERFRQHGATAIILGSGLGPLADKIENASTIPFDEIPGFAKSTAQGHRGELILGFLSGKPVIAMAGRLHRYEGWSDRQVRFPVGVMHALGARRLIASNAAGGVNPKLRVGDVLIIRDHINWLYESRRQPSESMRSSHAPEAFPQPRGNRIYDPQLASLASAAARADGFNALEGTYLATLGPNYETRAEYRMMRRIGVDAVGMSTVPEVLAGSKLNLKILALSIVSNVAAPDTPIAADHAEVIEAGNAAAGKLEGIVRRVMNSPESAVP